VDVSRWEEQQPAVHRLDDGNVLLLLPFG